MKKTLLNLALLGTLVMPGFVDAMSYTYTCADLTGGTASCTGSTITFTASSQSKSDPTGAAFQFATPGTYYVTATIAGTGTGEMFIDGNSVTGTPINYSTDLADEPIVSPGGNIFAGILIIDDGSFDGTVADICVSDALGECSTPPPPPSPTGQATSTLDQAQRNLWNAYFAFFAMMVFTVWLGRSKQS